MRTSVPSARSDVQVTIAESVLDVARVAWTVGVLRRTISKSRRSLRRAESTVTVSLGENTSSVMWEKEHRAEDHSRQHQPPALGV